MIYFEYGFLWMCIIMATLMVSIYNYLMFIKKLHFEFQDEIYKLLWLLMGLLLTIHFVRITGY